MKISYYLNKDQKNNLCCRINDDTEEVTFSMGYTVAPKKWDSKKEELDIEDIHCYTLNSFKRYLVQRYEELVKEGKGAVLTSIKDELLPLIEESGIEGIEEIIFDNENHKDDVPEYKEFIRAFEKFSGLKRNEYKVSTIDTSILFHTDDNIYEMDTYEGKTKLLRGFIENRSYEEIFTVTEPNIWSEIYLDGGISKGEFIPMMQKEWELYWEEKFKEIKEQIGKTDHLKPIKEASWKRFQVYMECYNDNADAIDSAFDIDMDVLYPLAVITMMNIFDADTCYTEYCEMEFSEWDTIEIDEEDMESPIFHIRPYEFF